MEYVKDQHVIMRTVGVFSNSKGKPFIEMVDDDNNRFNVYDVQKYQFERLTEKIEVIVKGFDSAGNPYFVQDLAAQYKAYYEFGKEYPFSVKDVQMDYNSKASYYVVEDNLFEHRYYFHGEQLHEVGDDCMLIVNSLTNRGFIDFKDPAKIARREAIEENENKQNQMLSDGDKQERKQSSTDGMLCLPDLEEGTNVELKSSIVFRKAEPNIDEQLFIIVRTLVGFMNAEGGKLYIGVRDYAPHQITGIEKDYPYLNDGKDGNNGQYKPCTDSYELKIRNALSVLSQGAANELCEFEFVKETDTTYCIITVKPALQPIWVSRYLLFQRHGNTTHQLANDDITFFVMKRCSNMIPRESALSEDVLVSSIRKAMNEERKRILDNVGAVVQHTDEVKYYIIWKSDATWCMRSKETDLTVNDDIIFQLPVYDNAKMKGANVVFCYASGTVNQVKLAEFKSKKKRNEWNKYGFNAAETPVCIYIAHPSEALAVLNIDSNGTEYVKVHSLTDFNPTKGAKSQGPRIVPASNRVLKFKLLSVDELTKVRHLLAARNQTTSFSGIPTSTVDPLLAREIKEL